MAASGKRRFGLALMGLGVALFVPGVLAGHASAWDGSCFDYAPQGQPWTEFQIQASSIDTTLVNGPGQSFSDGALQVTFKNAVAANAQPLGSANIGSLDFTANIGVDATYVRATDVTADQITQYAPEAVAGKVSSKNAATPIGHITFCYDVETAPTTTTTSTTTTAARSSTTTTTAAPATTAAPTTTVPGSVQPTVEVLAETEVQGTAPEIAFSGAESRSLTVAGATLLVAGLLLVSVERAGLLRRGRHAR
jgi:hypothetical protein